MEAYQCLSCERPKCINCLAKVREPREKKVQTPEEKRAYHRNYYRNNEQHIKEYQRTYYQNDREHHIKVMSDYYYNNKEAILNKRKLDYQAAQSGRSAPCN